MCVCAHAGSFSCPSVHSFLIRHTYYYDDDDDGIYYWCAVVVVVVARTLNIVDDLSRSPHKVRMQTI